MASSASEHGFRPQLVKIALGPADKKQERVDAVVFLQGLIFFNVLVFVFLQGLIFANVLIFVICISPRHGNSVENIA